MKIPLKFVQFHTPVFHHGVNLGDKVDYTKRNIALILDEKNHRLEIHFNGHISGCPLSNVVKWDPIDAESAGFEPKPTFFQKGQQQPQQSAVAGQPIKAQVENPIERVQNPPSKRSVHASN
jgi:hypothetical protein